MVLSQTARDVMTQTLITARPEMVLIDVVKLLLRWHISGVPIVDTEQRLVGLITEHDLVKVMFMGHAADTTAGEIMTRDVETCSPAEPLSDIISRFASRRFRRVPVVENGRVVGIISRRDIIREMERLYS